MKDQRKLSESDFERDEECGICMENSAKMVLPNCGHSLCISCFHDCLKRMSSTDLWALISNDDVIDTAALAEENLRRFYLYTDSLPFLAPETPAIQFDYMI
ncbi:RING-H2 FINGER PROTEIN ATL47-LIKE [Salix viminalis]|uniref:RING-H2 FINGER PROTEIN ATL47-LIKE n=1 Tax=Salix viminalis TaxID=40686 RepID=A0A9Q0Z5A0_SALVM|nr:RING-H2 FINGER PROTEIN ATL47-LIKE [Salix viminalis]